MRISRACLLLLPILSMLASCESNSERYSGRTVVCFCFDDEHASTYEEAFPILREHGYTATLVVNSGWLGRSGRFTWEQLEEMVFDNGWELAGHTRHHVNLASCSEEVARDEIVGEYELYLRKGFSPVMFALPAGEASTRDFEIIAECYDNIRTSRDLSMTAPVNPHYLGYFSYWTEYEPESVFLRLQRGIENRENLIVLGFHTLLEDAGNQPTNCTPEDFRSIVRYVSTLDVEVMTMREAVELFAR